LPNRNWAHHWQSFIGRNAGLMLLEKHCRLLECQSHGVPGHCRDGSVFAPRKLKSARAVSETDARLPLYRPWRIRNSYNFCQNHQVEFPIASSPRLSGHPSPFGDQIIHAVVATDATVQHDAINVFAKVCSC
jgi:hypothetical protein